MLGALSEGRGGFRQEKKINNLRKGKTDKGALAEGPTGQRVQKVRGKLKFMCAKHDLRKGRGSLVWGSFF